MRKLLLMTMMISISAMTGCTAVSGQTLHISENTAKVVLTDQTYEVTELLEQEITETDVLATVYCNDTVVPITAVKTEKAYYILANDDDGVSCRFKTDGMLWNRLSKGDTITIQQVQEYDENDNIGAVYYTCGGRKVEQVKGE